MKELVLSAAAGLPRAPEDSGARAAKETGNALKEVMFPVSRFTSQTTVQLPS